MSQSIISPTSPSESTHFTTVHRCPTNPASHTGTGRQLHDLTLHYRQVRYLLSSESSYTSELLELPLGLHGYHALLTHIYGHSLNRSSHLVKAHRNVFQHTFQDKAIYILVGWVHINYTWLWARILASNQAKGPNQDLEIPRWITLLGVTLIAYHHVQ